MGRGGRERAGIPQQHVGAGPKGGQAGGQQRGGIREEVGNSMWMGAGPEWAGRGSRVWGVSDMRGSTAYHSKWGGAGQGKKKKKTYAPAFTGRVVEVTPLGRSRRQPSTTIMRQF